MVTKEQMTEVITEWVLENFGLTEAEDPSWNIELLAEHIVSALEIMEVAL